MNRIDGVMVSVLASGMVGHGFEHRSGQTKHYKICICCFSSTHSILRRKIKDWLARNRDNVGDMSICGLLFQLSWHYKKPNLCVGLVQSGPNHLLNEN